MLVLVSVLAASNPAGALNPAGVRMKASHLEIRSVCSKLDAGVDND
jgi:hypothetical protein